jgi:hypothetical protein
VIAQPKSARYGGSDGVKLVLSDNATGPWPECEVAGPARSRPMGEVR